MIKTTKNKNDMDEKTTKLSNNTNPTVTYNTANWEQRRYEIAKTVIAGMFAHGKEYFNPTTDFDTVVWIADELIKRLKK